MKKLRIVLDCDGVLSQTMEEVVRLFNLEHGGRLTVADITQWILPHQEMYQYFSRPGFFAGLKAIPHSRRIVRDLIASGDDVVIATATCMEGWPERKAWLQRMFPQIPEANILRKENKSDVHGDVMLDDGVHNLETSICTFRVLFDQPWNRDEKRFIRVGNWLEFGKFVADVRRETPGHYVAAMASTANL